MVNDSINIRLYTYYLLFKNY